MAKAQKIDYTSNRANGTQKLPDAHYVRFTEAQNVRLHDARHEAGQSIQGFLHDAAIRALDEYDRLRAERSERRRTYTSGDPLQQGPNPLSDRPRGMGLREKMKAIYGDSHDEPEIPEEVHAEAPASSAPPLQTPQIVINTGAQTAPPSISTLASWIMKAPESKQDDRLSAAVELLGVTAKDDAEKQRLAEALDEKLTALGKRKSISPFDIFGTIDKFVKPKT